MSDAARFYAERDRRTREYGVADVFDAPVGIVVGADAAASPGGQLAALALVNMLARMHRRLRLHVPPVPLLRPSLVPAARLDEAAVRLARAIDPFIDLEAGAPGPYAVGLGTACPHEAPWYTGAHGHVACLDRRPVPFDDRGDRSLGAGLAACLAAASLCRQVLGRPQRPVRLSAWDCSEGDRASNGPDLTGPLDVGRVLQVGAGGVGACLAYWLWAFGVTGDWRVVDRDAVELHNTNRALAFLAHHAGWPGGAGRNKAEVAAALVGGTPLPAWYHELDHDGFKPDLVLPLANEHGVRRLVAARGEPVVLHATTSRTWEAQLHRHIPDRDDCIVCRMPEAQATPRFGCAAVTLPQAGAPSADGALPFLSATAGLLLLSGLFRLQHGNLAAGPENLYAVCFDNVRRAARVGACRCGCGAVLSRGARRRAHAGRRWSHLDLAAAAGECVA